MTVSLGHLRPVRLLPFAAAECTGSRLRLEDGEVLRPGFPWPGLVFVNVVLASHETDGWRRIWSVVSRVADSSDADHIIDIGKITLMLKGVLVGFRGDRSRGAYGALVRFRGDDNSEGRS